MIPYFQRLGSRVEDAWHDRNYDEDLFPELALDALERDPAATAVTVEEVVDWTFSSSHPFQQPRQTELFGQPPLTVFQAPRFYIEVLFWLSGTTSIHEHAFSGAFTVLAGSSVHSHWRFSPERTVNSRMVCGRLERVTTEILRPGAVRQIHSGDRLIHQLFHLDLPSVTVVVRTFQDRHHLPQFKYLPPGLAIDHDSEDATRLRRLILLDGMARGQIDGLPRYARKLIETSDLETLYLALDTLTRRKTEAVLLQDLYGIAFQRHGEIVELFRQVCEWERRTRVITILRSKITDPEARFLLALLMLMPDRNAIFETIRLQFPGMEPLTAIERCFEVMSGKENIGFELNDANRVLLRGLIEGLDADDLLQRMRTEFQSDAVDSGRDRILDHVQRLAKSDLLFPLLSESPVRDAARAA